MEPAKRKLSVFAKSKGYELDDLQALAEAEQLPLFARLKPFTARFGDLAGHPILVVDGNGRTVTHTGTRTIKNPEYAVLRQHEVAILRAEKHLTIRMWIAEGYEEGFRIPTLSNEHIFYWLLEPQTIGMDEVFINDDSLTADVLAKAHLLNDPTAVQSAQHGETLSVTMSEIPPVSVSMPPNKWDETALRRLLIEYGMPGATQKKLGQKYGVSKQHIGSLLKKAESLYGLKKATPYDALRWSSRSK